MQQAIEDKKNGHKEIIIIFIHEANSSGKVCQLAKVYYIPYPKSQGPLQNRGGKGVRGSVTDNITKQCFLNRRQLQI